MRFDFHAGRLFQQIDDIHYKNHDVQTYRRFLKIYGGVRDVHSSLLTSAIKRYDIDGDGRLNKKEFEDFVKVSITFDKKEAHRRGMEPTLKKEPLKQGRSMKNLSKPSKDVKVLQKQHKKMLGSQFRVDLNALDKQAKGPLSPGKDEAKSFRSNWCDR